MGQVDGDALRGDLIVADGRDRAPGAGANQVEHDRDGGQHQQGADRKVGHALDAGDAHCAVDQRHAVRFQQRRVLERDVQAGAVVAEIAGVDDVLDNLAERQRDDGEIVARKAQDRHADDDAEQPGRRAARQESQRQRGKHGQAVAQQRPYQHPGKSPHAHEPGVPQAQLARKPTVKFSETAITT